MNMQELLQLSREELLTKLTQSRQELFAMRENVALGKEKNVSQLKSLRAIVARVSTALRAKKPQ